MYCMCSLVVGKKMKKIILMVLVIVIFNVNVVIIEIFMDKLIY